MSLYRLTSSGTLKVNKCKQHYASKGEAIGCHSGSFSPKTFFTRICLISTRQCLNKVVCNDGNRRESRCFCNIVLNTEEYPGFVTQISKDGFDRITNSHRRITHFRVMED